MAGAGLAVLPCFLGAEEPTLMQLTAPIDELDREGLWLVVHEDMRDRPRVPLVERVRPGERALGVDQVCIGLGADRLPDVQLHVGAVAAGDPDGTVDGAHVERPVAVAGEVQRSRNRRIGDY